MDAKVILSIIAVIVFISIVCWVLISKKVGILVGLLLIAALVLGSALGSCGSDEDDGFSRDAPPGSPPIGETDYESPTDTIKEEEPNSEEEPFSREAPKEEEPAGSEPVPGDPSPNDYTEDPDVPVTTVEEDRPKRKRPGGCGDGTVRGPDGKCPNSGESALDTSQFGGPGASSAPRNGDQYTDR